MAANVVTKVVDQLREYGDTRRGWLGVRIQDVTEDVAEAMGLDKAEGALVTDVPDGPAKEAGLESGDVILSFDGEPVKDTRELVREVGSATVGKPVRETVLRDGTTPPFKVTLGRREEAEGTPVAMQQEDLEPEEELNVLGLTLRPLTSQMREEMSLSEDAAGLVILSVDETSQAFEKGLRAGDLITEAGQQKVDSLDGLESRIADAKEAGRKSILLLIRRNGEPRFVALSLESDEE